MHMVANFWPGTTLEQFQVELAQLEGKEQPQATLLPQIDLPGGMDGRPEQRKGLVVDHYSVLPAS